MGKNSKALELFHPIIRGWFAGKYGLPTDVQEKSWPLIAGGKHVLLTAPTGSGKTLAAFLWALNQLLSGVWDSGGTVKVLYVSPLKALNTDVSENLLVPLAEINEASAQNGIELPDIYVQTRSGDTPGAQRQRMLRRPPEILITTPESLNLLLSSRKAVQIFRGIRTVILDEIHAVVAGKRGTHLITAVDRLVGYAGDFQRIALSATVKPVERVAEYVGGFKFEPGDGEYLYQKREVRVVQSGDRDRFRIAVRFPENAHDSVVEGSRWPVLVKEFRNIIEKNRSTLLFTNTRRLSEKITRLINEESGGLLAYSHHGSLSKEIRSAVEKKLRDGALSAIVATSSLELGIDIGSLDEVVLVQTPPSIASGLQRIGRSGHAVGGMSSGVLYPTHGMDFLEAAVMADSIMKRDIEPVKPVENPLDVLAQIIISMTGVKPWDRDDLYGFLKSSYPFYSLSRSHFDLVIEMLGGRYEDTKIRELKPRVYIDNISNTVQGAEGVLLILYHSGGTIPDRGYFGLRLQDSKEKIGELDEEFVWERSIGDKFSMGAQSWVITSIDHQNVEVVPWSGPVKQAPFWKAEKGSRSHHFYSKIGEFLETWGNRIGEPLFLKELQSSFYMDRHAADELIGYLKRQKKATGPRLPNRHHIVVEHFDTSGSVVRGKKYAGSRYPGNDYPVTKQVIIHTLWGEE